MFRTNACTNGELRVIRKEEASFVSCFDAENFLGEIFFSALHVAVAPCSGETSLNRSQSVQSPCACSTPLSSTETVRPDGGKESQDSAPARQTASRSSCHGGGATIKRSTHVSVAGRHAANNSSARLIPHIARLVNVSIISSSS